MGDLQQPPVLVGHGWDRHRLEVLAPAGRGRPLVVGGVRLEHDRGAVGHSDGDVLLHALTDALLGAIAGPDIGQLFPDTDAANDGADSAEFVHEAMRRVRAAGYGVGNVDCTVALERPRLAPVKERVRARLAELLAVPPGRVNVKGKTGEGVDAVGEGRAIEAHVVVTLVREGGRA